MNITRAMVFGAILLLGMATWAQEFPRAEVGFDYSYARFAPSAPYSQGHSLNGGGGSVIFNINRYLGIKADLQGYGSTLVGFNIPSNSSFPGGVSGNVQGNLFTYLFGPQIKIRAEKWQPFVHALFGGAHTNVYANAFDTLCQPIAGGCTLSTAPAADAFAMAFGGGVDIPLNKTLSIRPVGIDYLMTRFTNPFTSTNNQNNFRYTAGVVINLAHTH